MSKKVPEILELADYQQPPSIEEEPSVMTCPHCSEEIWTILDNGIVLCANCEEESSLEAYTPYDIDLEE